MPNFINLQIAQPNFLPTINNRFYNHLNLKDSDSVNKSSEHYENLCPICYGTIKNECYIEDCLHKFCLDCLNIWQKTKKECPLCRSKINRVVKASKSEIFSGKKKNFQIKLFKKK